jgi:preprotein translocase subunit SecE
MNRQAKRMMQRQKTTGPDRLEAMRERRAAVASARTGTGPKRSRTTVKQFMKDVRLELKKVQWPTRQEMISYTVVVLIAVVVLTSLVFAMDLAFSKAVLHIFGNGAG